MAKNKEIKELRVPAPEAAPTWDGAKAEELSPEEHRKRLEIAKLEIDVAKGHFDLQNLMQRAAENEASSVFVYNFFDHVDEDSVRECIHELGNWSRLSPGAPITIVFNTAGGLVMQGLALFDYLTMLRLAGHKITTVTFGRAASMGAVLLQAGDRRIVGPNAFVLLHEVSSGTWGKQSEKEDDVAFTSRLQDKLIAILAKRSVLTARQIKARWKKTDWWLDANEAVQLGFADGVLGENVEDLDFIRFGEPQPAEEDDEKEETDETTGAS